MSFALLAFARTPMLAAIPFLLAGIVSALANTLGPGVTGSLARVAALAAAVAGMFVVYAGYSRDD